jgi:hypothetical protein
MKNKSFLSKLEELKPEVPIHLEVERKLIPRLKFMGYVMYFFCLLSFVFALTIKEEEELLISELETNSEIPAILTDESELELAATEVLNFYFVSLVFALVGTACFLIAWKKGKKLLHGSLVHTQSRK